MGRKSIIIVAFLFVTLRSIAQSGSSTFEFIENKGQWESAVKFRGELSAGAFYLQARGFTVLQHNHQDLSRIYETTHRGLSNKGRNENEDRVVNNKLTLRSHAYRVTFEGGSEDAIVLPDKVQPTYNNYLIGNDPSKWQKNVKIFQAVTYKNVYPNIDVRYYSENGKLKYDFIVYPGGDASRIAMKYDGASKLSVKNKELIIKTTVGDVKELYPYTFQFDPTKGRKEIECKYVLVNGNTVKFSVANYDKNATLVIDPSLFFSSFTGSPVNEYGFSATPGPGGVLYSAGICDAQGYPVTAGAFQTQFGGGDGAHRWDISITKFSTNGGQRLFGTYLGGSGDEYPHSIISDPQGDLVVMGRTYSPNFPGTSVGTRGLSDILVTKLNSTGTGLIGSLIIGGSGIDGVNISDEQADGSTAGSTSTVRFYGDDSRSEVNLDPAGNIYVAAQTKSGNFPVTAGVFQNALGGLQDGVIMKITPNCNSILFASYFGGTGDDAAVVIDIDPLNGNIYIGGATNSNNLPGDKTGVMQPTFAGNECDGFVSIINPNGTAIIKTTYLGTPQVDAVYGVKFDHNGFPYVMGITQGTWPVTPGVWSNPGGKQFVGKLRPDLSGYVFSTVFGTNTAFPNISPVAFLVDRCENLYISGWGGWIVDGTQDPYGQAGTAGLPITPDAIKSVTDNRDFYFIVIKKNAQSLLYGTFFGQDGGFGEHVDGGTSRFDEQGVIYQAICANCFGNTRPVTNPFPTTGGVIGPQNGTGNGGCNLAAIKLGFNFAGVASGPKVFFNGVPDSVSCVPATFNFRDTVLNAKSYQWDFGDGSPPATTTVAQINHTYNAVGNYRIRLIAIDSTTCNIRDTAFVNVIVRDDKANLAFNPVKLPPCESLSYRFDNLSTAPPGKPFGAASFIWDFGDGTRVTSGSGAVTHSYAAAGTYKVKLILKDTNYCNAPDSLPIDIRIAPLVKAQFETPPSGCAPYDAVFNNTSLAGQSFFWDFGDGTTSTQVNPVHTYTNVGTYIVRLRAIDSATCNIIDSTQQSITVNPLPFAEFSHVPVAPVPANTPTIFTNLSTGGVRYKWLFGDGDSTIKTTMDTVKHQYNATGQYNACLIVFNQFGCTDTVCHPVEAEVNPLLDVPNAFTPGRFGVNSTIRVQGFGISKMIWRIYNRWGQVVFESNDYRIGWDGTFKGKPQPMDVYAYTLDVNFTDGTKTRKTGDITLIR